MAKRSVQPGCSEGEPDFGISGADLAQILGRLPSALLLVDRRGLVHAANPAAERLFGCAERPLVGARLVQLLAAVSRPRADALLHLLTGQEVPSGQGLREQLTGLRPSGQSFAAWFTLHRQGPPAAPVLVVAVEPLQVQQTGPGAAEVARYRDLFDNAPDMYFTVARNGTVSSVNRLGAAHLGYRKEDLIGRALTDVVHPEDRERLRRRLDEIFLNQIHSTDMETRTLHRDGTVLWVRVRARLTITAAGRPAELRMLCRDVTEERRILDALRQSEERFRLLLESTGEGVYAVDGGGRVTLANPACLRLLGYASEADLLGKPVHELAHHSRADGTPIPPGECAVLRVLHTGIGTHRDDEVFWRADGTMIPVEYRSHPIVRGGVTEGAVVTFSDISERLAARAQLEYLAEHDHLTNLPNRSLLFDRLRSGLARARRLRQPLGLLFLDLDGFKPVNDRYGHRVGDELLVEVAQRLRGAVRESDTVARLGGDEFAVLVEALASRATADGVARKLRQAIGAPFHVNGRRISLGVSVGVALYPEDAAELDTLMHHADREMYREKAGKKH